MTKNLLALLAAALLAVTLTGRANAALTLMIDDGVNPTITVTDDGAGDLVLGTGVLSFVGTIGDYDVVTQTAVSSSPTPFLNVSYSITTIGAVASTLTIKISDTDFLFGSGGKLISSVNNSSQDHQATAKQLLDVDNVLFGGTPEFVADHGSLTVNVSETLEIPVALAGAFSLTEVLTFTHSGSGTTTGDITSTVIPAPAALPAGLALLGLIAARRRRAA